MLFSGAQSVGWVFLAMGLFFVALLGGGRLFDDLRLAGFETTRTRGVVVAVHPPSGSTEDRPTYPVDFRYQPEGGSEREASGYVVGEAPGVGAPLWVEYLTGRPEVARPMGGWRTPLGLFGLVPCVFPLVGLVFVADGLRRRRREISLLEDGEVARGRVTQMRSTSVRVNGRPLFEYHLVFEDGRGTTQTLITRSARGPELGGKEAWVLYDPWRPERALALHAVPATVRFDGRGQARPMGGAAFVRCLLPALVAGELLWLILA